MPTVAVNDIYAVRVFNSCLDQIGLNVVHYRITVIPVTPPSSAAFFDNVDAAIAAAYKPVLCQDAVYQGTASQRLFPTVAVSDPNPSRAGNGTGGVTAMAKQVALVVSKRSGLAGRKNRGRMYVSFPSDTDSLAFGLPSAAYLALVNTLVTAIFQNQIFGGVTAVPVIYQRLTPAASPAITAIRVNSKFGTQRRRGSYGKTNSLVPA
jgi:hypothetical protein